MVRCLHGKFAVWRWRRLCATGHAGMVVPGKGAWMCGGAVVCGTGCNWPDGGGCVPRRADLRVCRQR